MPIQLPFALREGRLISVTEASSGLACGCTCPGCGAPVVARKGKHRSHHFAHHGGQTCAQALESALHRLAKEIFEAGTTLQLPGVDIGQHPHWRLAGKQWTYDRVYVEKRLRSLRPDLILEARGKRLLVEIAVTHRAGWEKVRQLHRQNLVAVEVDLGAWLREQAGRRSPVTREMVRMALIEETTHKYWLFNPRKNFLEAALRKYTDARPVRRRSWRGHSFYQVMPCPRRLRSYQPAFGPPVFFADVFQDCLDCPFCLEVKYQKEFRGFREASTRPEAVLCWGKWEGRLADLMEVLG